MKEFNLSDKIKEVWIVSRKDDNILVSDVKEFIKRLKEEMYSAPFIGEVTDPNDIIDKLAGEKLI